MASRRSVRRALLLVIAAGSAAAGLTSTGAGAAAHTAAGTAPLVAGQAVSKTLTEAAEPGSTPEEIHKQLGQDLPHTPGMVVRINHKTNVVEVEVPDSANFATAKSAVEAVTQRYGDAVLVKKVPATHAELSAIQYGGGVYIGSPEEGQAGCSSGFTMVNYSTGIFYVTTAGHCVRYLASTPRVHWYTNRDFAANHYIGNLIRSWYNGPEGWDAAVIRYTNPGITHTGTIYNHRARIWHNVVSSWDVPVNTRVCKSGMKTGTTCGVVIDTCAHWDPIEPGRLICAYETNICNDSGDSGGGVWYGDKAIAMMVGGNGGAIPGTFNDDYGCPRNHNNTGPHRSYLQKIPYIENALGITIY